MGNTQVTVTAMCPSQKRKFGRAENLRPSSPDRFFEGDIRRGLPPLLLSGFVVNKGYIEISTRLKWNIETRWQLDTRRENMVITSSPPASVYTFTLHPC